VAPWRWLGVVMARSGLTAMGDRPANAPLRQRANSQDFGTVLRMAMAWCLSKREREKGKGWKPCCQS
jgi:hypothetical protein